MVYGSLTVKKLRVDVCQSDMLHMHRSDRRPQELGMIAKVSKGRT